MIVLEATRSLILVTLILKEMTWLIYYRFTGNGAAKSINMATTLF